MTNPIWIDFYTEQAPMQIIVFTKMLRGSSAQEVGRIASDLGFSGLDLAVRDGQCCTPVNVSETLPGAMAVWKDFDLNVPIVSLEPTPTDPADPNTRRIFAACQKAGIPNIKLGYWTWTDGEDYWKKFDQSRRDLEVFQKLAREFGICCLLHTHSGNCYASNASGAMHLARGFDPKYIGVYLDPGHLSLDGEPWPMALAMTGNYLKAVGVKSVAYRPTNKPGGPHFQAQWGQLDEGLVDWNQIIDELVARGHDVPFSVHAEYSQEGLLPALRPLVERDVKFLKGIIHARSK